MKWTYIATFKIPKTKFHLPPTTCVRHPLKWLHYFYMKKMVTSLLLMGLWVGSALSTKSSFLDIQGKVNHCHSFGSVMSRHWGFCIDSQIGFCETGLPCWKIVTMGGLMSMTLLWKRFLGCLPVHESDCSGAWYSCPR